MTTNLADAMNGRRRRPSVLEPQPPPPPPWDLSMVNLPRWLMPMIRDLMEVAERSFGPRSGIAKKIFVEQGLHSALAMHATSDPEDFAPQEFRGDLVGILIEGVWGLQFRRPRVPKSGLKEALDKMKEAGFRLSKAPDQGFLPPA